MRCGVKGVIFPAELMNYREDNFRPGIIEIMLRLRSPEWGLNFSKANKLDTLALTKILDARSSTQLSTQRSSAFYRAQDVNYVELRDMSLLGFRREHKETFRQTWDLQSLCSRPHLLLSPRWRLKSYEAIISLEEFADNNTTASVTRTSPLGELWLYQTGLKIDNIDVRCWGPVHSCLSPGQSPIRCSHHHHRRRQRIWVLLDIFSKIARFRFFL